MQDQISLQKYPSTLDFLLEGNDYQIIVNDDDSSKIFFYRRTITGYEYILQEKDINDFYSDQKKFRRYFDISNANKTYFENAVIRTNRFVFEPRNPVIYDIEKKTLNICPQYERTIDKNDNELPSTFLKFVDRLVPDPIQRDLFLNWVSCSIERKLETYLFLVSPVEGIGKTMFYVQVLKSLVGSSLSGLIGSKTFESDFNAMAKNKLYILLDELEITSVKSLAYFKTLTNHERECVGKGTDSEEVPVYDNLVITSNNIHRYMIEDGARRVFMPDLTEVKLTTQEVDEFVSGLPKERSRIYNFLKSYKKDFTKTRRFLGPNHNIQADEYLPPFVSIVQHWINQQGNSNVISNITLIDMRKQYREFTFKSARTLYDKLKIVKSLPFSISFNGKKSEITIGKNS